MPLPTPNLDDLRFQRDLVDEARRRIIRYCPEWTDYNLSDPGITLIELFAWMTEMLVYRLNRVPEKAYVKFLEMVGVRLQPASSARTELTFYLSVPFPIAPEDDTMAIVPQGLEVTTRPTEAEAEVTFTTDQRLIIAPPRLVQLRRDAEFHKNYLSRLGVEPFYAFGRPKPQVGDTFHLGFEESRDLSGYILRLAFECAETKAVGIRREDPPWVWECSLGEGRWEKVPPSTRRGERDTTGGLNNPEGALVLYLPLEMQPDQIHGRRAYWLRCRLEPRDEEQGMYAEPPIIKAVTAQALGGTTRATHAVAVRDEVLGTSNGEPGQIYHLEHAPILALGRGENVEVEEKRNGEVDYVSWQRVADFSDSCRHDRHYTLDEATGEICFGPSLRKPTGKVWQYGRVPETGRRIRIGQYRHGGGVVGNVPAGQLQVLRSAVPYVDRVTNLKRAEAGRDQETLEEAQMRARRELRAQQRAVTAEDFENLAKGASRAVARVKCNGASRGSAEHPPGTVELLVVPAAFDALRAGDLTKLALEPEMVSQIRAHLDSTRLLTSTLYIREPRYLGVEVEAKIAITEMSQPDDVQARVAKRRRSYISPLAIGEAGQPEGDIFGADWEGWPFGRDLYVSEVYSLLQQVPGVKHVLDVRLGYRSLLPGTEVPEPAEEDEEEAELPLSPVTEKSVRASPDTVLCSLDHEIEVVEL